ncbi:AlbA family DNA-binding domain-containing protein [Sunxiuqinia rutila]|uniref:AlbA family DNA-binding domain-containing protein n=1 Tax=Sunxiuqinia rutila TaxID=1397841 RepID=UPI003D36C63D
MKLIDDIIQFENENTALDFKAIQYKRNKFENLLKDFLSMANANTKEERYIIIGVNHKSNGNRDIIGVNEDFIDEAIYQQLIIENIEPEINFKYFPYKFETKTLGIFQIKDCLNPPYMLKKDFGSLKKGDSFIRKGSHQTRVTRADIDFFISQKLTLGYFTGSLSLYFSESKNKRLILKALSKIDYPSDKAAKKIKRIIKEKEEKLKHTDDMIGMFAITQGLNMLTGTPYENRSISTLRENLENVKETYQADDMYYLFEEKSHKINITIINNGEEYIEDASIEIIIKRNDCFLIADSVYNKPDHRSPIERINYASIMPSWEKSHYPKVDETDDTYIISEHIGDIKHKIPQDVFNVPIRLIVGRNCIGNDFPVSIKVYGKNLKEPIKDELIFTVNE